MKILVEVANKNISQYENKCDAILLGIKDYSVMNEVSFSIEEIKKVTTTYPKLEVFIKMNKNFFNDEIDSLKKILQEIDKLPIKGIFFYDIALLELKQELSLSVDLVWDQTHMVTNYRTCNYYYEQGVKYALLSKEITLDEILDIKENTNISLVVEVVSLPSVGFSRRKLLHNYYEDINENGSSTLSVLEKITNKKYLVKEEQAGTGFFLDEIINGTSIISSLYEKNIDYILMKEDKIPSFLELLEDTQKYIKEGCQDTSYVEKYKKLGDSTGFFFKKTIYRVKK